MIVVDVGCASIGGETSTDRLLEEFKPDVYYGFDPLVDNVEGFMGSTRVVFDSRAAWIRNGSVPFMRDTSRSTVVSAPPDSVVVECFDLAEWLVPWSLSELIVKIDAEGAEYALIDKINATGVDSRISLLLVEWHDVLPDAEAWRERLLRDVRCPVQEWE